MADVLDAEFFCRLFMADALDVEFLCRLFVAAMLEVNSSVVYLWPLC